MFLWWSDPYTGITAAFLFFSLLLVLRLAVWGMRRFRRWGSFGWTALVLWVLAAGPWLFLSARLSATAGQEQWTSIPDMHLTLNNGQRVSLFSLKGKVILLDFWATWCAPCRASEPALQELAQRYSAQNLVEVRISGDKDAGKWQRYLDAHPSATLEVRDGSDEIASSFHVIGRPTFVLIDRSGQLRWVQTSWTPVSYLLLRSRLQRLLK